MKFVVQLFFYFTIGLLSLAAEDHPASPSDAAETNWPGISYQVVFFKRILSDRLLLEVRIFATSKAPPTTLIGFPVPIPPGGLTKEDLRSGRYNPKPLSLGSSVMVEDATQQRYPALAPLSPKPGYEYIPGTIICGLKPGQAQILTVQFATPPPPPLPPGATVPPRQTVSFLLTNAKIPIAHVPLPSPTP